MNDYSSAERFNLVPTTRDQAPAPLAIVGIGCRFPGAAANPRLFWDNLLAGRDCIVDVPADRWAIDRFYDSDRNKPGKMYVKSGGFLEENIFDFDALFFGVSPREAASMDPQQRVLMEVSWEALEDAGIDPESLAGSETGVFVGGFMLDNKLTQLSPLNRHTIAANTAVGMTLTMLSNRLSYFYDLRGPSMTIDTACSASMVALDQACQSIWNGDSELALVGGVNIMHRPEIFIGLCKGGFLAPDGRSKAFDARANGYGRGEGAGIIVVKPLADAERDGDRIYAQIRATACNQDGRTDGITVPNTESQQALIRKVARRAQVPLKDIHYFEAHGTGTAVGDPLEMSAIGATIGCEKTADAPCIVGSVKSSIGHLEAASGVAGIIKTALTLQHRCVPPQANLQQLNPKIPFADLRLQVPRRATPLPGGEQPLYSAINSFGYGGTNAGALLQSYSPAAPSLPQGNIENASGQRWLLPLSARSKPALTKLAELYWQRLQSDTDEPALSDLCYSAGDRRAQLEHRLCISGANREELCTNLRQYLDQQPNPHSAEGHVSQARNKLAFVFTGMGPQWWGMGQQLFHSEPVFRAAVYRCDQLFRDIAGWSIQEEMLRPENESRIGETQIAQPANFVLQVALVELLCSWGIEPAAIVGHSVGEVASAYHSGILSLQQALLVSYQRSRIQKKAAHQGSMLAVGVNETEADALLEPWQGKVSIAAINGPSAITLAGDSKALEKIATQLDARGAFNRPLQVEVAYHSPTMDPLLDEIRSCLAELTPAKPTLPVYSTVTAARIKGSAYDAEYWCRNVRQPVYFYKTLEQMLADGYEDFIEIGPHPVLSTSIKESFSKHKVKGHLLNSLQRGAAEQLNLRHCAATLYTLGYRLHWANLASNRFCWTVDGEHCTPMAPAYVPLPTYPWQRERHWNDAPQAQRDRLGHSFQHAVLGAREEGPFNGWCNQVNSNYLPWLEDHKVEDLVILPGAAYIEAALCAHRETATGDACLLTDIRLHNAMVIDSDSERLMQTRVQQGHFEIHSHTPAERDQHTLHASGRLQDLTLVQQQSVDINALKAAGMQLLEAAEIYPALAQRGLQYGPRFQGIDMLWRRDGAVLARIRAHADISLPAGDHQLHPTLLDACFQALISALPEQSEFGRQVYIPVHIGQLRHYEKAGGAIYCHGTVTDISAQSIRGHISICDDSGRVLAEILDLRCQALRSLQDDAAVQLDDWAYQSRWLPQEALPDLNATAVAADEGSPGDPGSVCHIVLLPRSDAGQRLQQTFQQQPGINQITLYAAHEYRRLNQREYQLDPGSAEQLRQVFADQQQFRSYQRLCLVYGLAMEQASDDPVHLQASAQALGFLQAVQELDSPLPLKTILLTRDAHRVLDTDTCDGFAQSPVIGLARVAAMELPKLHCTAIDLDRDLSPQAMQQLLAECAVSPSVKNTRADNAAEQELALRGPQRFAYRLCHSPLHDAWRPQPQVAGPERNVELAPTELAQLCGAGFQQCSRRQPQDHEIEIQLLAAVVNGGNDDLQEVCARIVNTGATVRGYQPGEEIIACYRGELRRFVSLDPDSMLALRKPADWPATRAAGALSGLHQAQAALLDYGRVEVGSSVLILGSDTASGHWLAQLAASLGCQCVEVLAAADTSSGRQLHINSADLMQDLQARRPASGFDLILNSAGPAPHIDVDALLATRGCLINLQADLHQDVLPVPLASGKLQVQLHTADLLADALLAPAELQRQLQSLIANLDPSQVAARDRAPLPVLEAAALLTDPAAPGVLDLDSAAPLPSIPKPAASLRIRPDATYLISGGCGGFGLGMARWLVQQGARHLALVSRSGASNPVAKAAVAELEATGARVSVLAADIADRAATSNMLASIGQQLPPLAGIFHTAGVLDDRELMAIDSASLATVMRPKALGAWHLHSLTRHLPLDCFVLYSSVSALIGNRNQANYVAANLFLDNLAQHRHAHGLAATSINWGVLSDVGMAADANVIKHLAHIGIHGCSVDQAHAAFGQLMQAPVAQMGIFNIDWQRWSQCESASANPRFSELVDADADQPQGDSWSDLHAQGSAALTSASAQCFTGMLAATLKLAPEHIDPDTPINRYGLDSLMAIDLQMKIREEFKVDVSILELMKGNSSTRIAEVIATKLSALFDDGTGASDRDEREEQSAASPAETELESLADLAQDSSAPAEIDDMSEEQLDELLKRELELN
ncbi:MAG: SDR family NAD(P)-dependent oxidoreductase [Gammaproteobacteria bacterium]|nr:SDR family NAD(P)-dependent oxidoreductase [Gammaproteobacteria bacterium]